MLGSFFRKSNPSQHTELKFPHVEKDKHTVITNLHPETGKEIEMVVAPKPFFNPQNMALLAVLLILLSVVWALWSWMWVNSLETLQSVERQRHETVLDSLLQVKAGLENNLNQLEVTFSDLRSENDTLAQRLATTTNVIAEKESVIKEIKDQNTREETALRTQVQRLQTLKDRYETIIEVLSQKNSALMAENARLRGNTDSLSLKVSDLGKQLESQIRQTLSGQYRASSFRVELQRRNDKLTVKARRTRELNVVFDLQRVPSIYQGKQQLFLVITDDMGVPIESKNPIHRTIKGEKGEVAIIAQAVMLQEIGENQHIEIPYKLEDKLKKGTYLVSVYSDKGLLGVASFRLT